MNDRTPKPAAKPVKLSLLRQSYELYHAAEYGKAETPRPNTKEKPYNTYKVKPYYRTELQRLYLRDVFQISNKAEQAFPYDITLNFKGIWYGLHITIGETTLRAEKTKHGPWKVTIPAALVPEATKNGYISKRVHGNRPTIFCNISLQSDTLKIKNVASFTIFQNDVTAHYISQDKNGKKRFPSTLNLFKNVFSEKTLRYNEDGLPKLDKNDKPAYNDHTFLVYRNISPRQYISNSFVPMASELYSFYWPQRSIANDYFNDQEKKGKAIYFKFFDLNQVAPHPDADKRFLDPHYYAFSFIKACDLEGQTYFRLVNPETISTASFEKKLKDGTPVQEKFFKLSTGQLYDDGRSILKNPEKFYVIPPLEHGDIMGIKTALPMADGEHLEVISALANTNGFTVKVEPNVFILPSHWQDSTGNLKPTIQYDKATDIYKRIDPRANLIEEYDNKQKLMVTKQVNRNFACIPRTKKGGALKTTGNGSVTLTSNYYSTHVQFRSTKKTKLENVTVDVWDCIKHLGPDRLSFMRADEFIVIQYTTAEETIEKNPLGALRGFRQTTMQIKGKDGKANRLETGLAHKISKKQMWGVDNLDELADKSKDYKAPNRLHFNIGHGTDMFVVGCVKNGVPDWHRVTVTGQYRKGLDLANY